MKASHAHALVFCLLLAGCADKVRIATYGDSTMRGNDLVKGAHVQSPMNPPAELQRLFDDTSVIPENHGVRGATCLDFLLGQIGGASLAWEVEMRNSDADIVVMNVGINDVLRQTTASIPACYKKLMSISRACGKTVSLRHLTLSHFSGTRRSLWS